MQLFNNFIDAHCLLDAPLVNKSFTWSNKQPNPIFSRLDRVLFTNTWNTLFPFLQLTALPCVVSDHSPLLFKCRQLRTAPKPFRLELFWLYNKDAQDIIKRVWSSSFNCNSPFEAFTAKTLQLHKALRSWHIQNYGKLNILLVNAKAVVLFLDKLEELRQLTPLEFNLRILGRERAFQLTNILEMRWHQRSRTNWLRYGDRNTKYFHALATSRKRKNFITKLIVNDQEITDSRNICDAFTSYYINLLGTSSPAQPFSPSQLFPIVELDLSSLAAQFTETEVRTAVMDLSNDKSSGPDGVPNEFYKLNWETVKSDLLNIFNSLHDNLLDLQSLNHARIVLIPKVDSASSLSDFRPISVISYIPKLISKVLAMRLAAFMPQLIPQSQTGFIKNRLIAENFIVARELLSAIDNQQDPTLLLNWISGKPSTWSVGPSSLMFCASEIFLLYSYPGCNCSSPPLLPQ